jgi:thiol-disulfide isomerase/thioredoxin
MKNYKVLILLVTTVFFASCSKDDSGSGNGAGVVDDTPVSGKFQKRVLIEDFTGTWCGYCPRVSYGIDRVMEQTAKAVPVAIHQQSSGSDPYHFSGATPLMNQIGLTGFPTAMLNRVTTWSYPENSNIQQVKNQTGNNAGLGVAMNSTVSGGTINLDVNVKFAQDYTNLKLVVYAVEDNLFYNQTNYTSFYGGGSYISNFEHDNVLRACFTNILGDDITVTTTAGTTFTKNFSVPVPSNVSNVANMRFVAFVIGFDKKAINVRATTPGENQSFEVNP